MSKRFETLFALDNNLYAADCPVIVSAGVLLLDTESNRLAAQLKFRNVSPKTIWALTVTLACVDTGNHPTAEEFTYQYQDLSAGRGEEFGSKKAILIPDNNTRGFRITEITAVFSDGSSQTAAVSLSPLPAQEPLSAALGDEQLVKQYRLATNEQAVYVPTSKDGLQLCPCGHWHSQPFCASCGLSYAQAKQAYDLPVLKENMNRRLEQEAADREEQRCAEAYQKAFKIMDTAKLPLQLQKAEKDFDALGDYQNSREMADTCRRMLKDLALKKAEAPKNVYDLKEAEKIFLHLGEMEDCQELAQQCRVRYEKGTDKMKAKAKKTTKRIAIAAVIVAVIIAMIPISINYIIPAVKYAQAEKQLSTAQYDDAIAGFTALGEYKDAASRVDEASYAKADALLQEGSFEEASALFSALGQYEDSKTRVKECGYRFGKALMEQQKYADAYEQFKAVKSYEDAAKLMDSCCAALAEAEYAAARYDEAVAWYGKMGTIDKENETYLDSLYQAAMAAMEEGSHQKAVDLLQKAGNYSNSPDKRREAMYAYVTANLSNTNKTTHLYLTRLASVDYADSDALYERLYAWNVTVTANTSKTDTENMDSIPKNRAYYFHLNITGGQPNETITVYAVTKNPAGKTTQMDPQEVKHGDQYYISGSAPYKTGTATITVYDAATNRELSSHTVRFK